MIHIFTMHNCTYLHIIYFALCAILRRAYAVYMTAAGVVEAKTAASHRGRTGSRDESLLLRCTTVWLHGMVMLVLKFLTNAMHGCY